MGWQTRKTCPEPGKRVPSGASPRRVVRSGVFRRGSDPRSLAWNLVEKDLAAASADGMVAGYAPELEGAFEVGANRGSGGWNRRISRPVNRIVNSNVY